MRAVTLALALLLPTLAACSSSSAEEPAAPSEQEQASVAWKSEIAEALGSDTFDFAALQQQATADCARTEVDQWTVALALSGARSSIDLTRVGLTHACPDVVTSYDAAVQAVDSAADPLALVCAPGVELSDADALLAELACAGR